MRSFYGCIKLEKPLGPLLSGLSLGHSEPGLLGIHKDNGCSVPIILMGIGSFSGTQRRHTRSSPELSGCHPSRAQICQHLPRGPQPEGGAQSQGARVGCGRPGSQRQGASLELLLKGCAIPRALFLLQEVHKTVSTHLNIISTSLHGEF